MTQSGAIMPTNNYHYLILLKIKKPMIDNNRKYERTEVVVDVQLSFGDAITTIAQTHDVSEGGMFLKLDDTSPFPLGDMVIVHFKDPLNNNADTTKDAAIVRVADHGIALAYVDFLAF